MVWAVAFLFLEAATLATFRFAARLTLEQVGPRLQILIPVTALLVSLFAAISFVISIAGHASLAGLLLASYRELSGPCPTEREPQPDSPSIARGLLWATPAVVLVGAALACAPMFHDWSHDEELAITAHRAGKLDGPENTVAALRQAIVDGADWAEIDVQLTRDGAIVVLHDTDLRRIGGGPRNVGDVTLEEIRAIDVGTPLAGPRFAGERVATLEEMIDEARGKIRLNIEFKPHGAKGVAPLVDAVMELIRRKDFAAECRVCGQSLEALRRAKAAEPKIEVGFIAGAAIGDLSRLEVDFLMVHRPLATRRLVEAARLEEMEIHVWTVNDLNQLPPLMDIGIANVITDDPRGMRQTMEEIEGLSFAERLLLRVRNALLD